LIKLKTYKGFDKDLKCRGFQYEIGKEYETDKAKACKYGFHACENPLDVFKYYAPHNSRYCEVEQSGTLDKHSEDSKVASTKIRIVEEIGLKGIIEAGVKFILDKVNYAKDSNTGYQSAATNTGERSAAIVTGCESIAIATGYQSKAKGAIGCFIVLAEWYKDDDGNYHIKTVKANKVDGKTIKADTFYTLRNGEFVEVDNDN